MSYTPHIYVDYSDLKKLNDKTQLFEDWQYYDERTDDGYAMETIRWDFLHNKPFKFKEYEILTICPEFSSQNLLVRNKLTELGIEFTLSY